MTKYSMPSKLKQCFFIALAILFFSLLFSPYHIFLIEKLTADDASYLSHGFSLGLNFDLKYKNSIHDWVNPITGAPVHPIGPGFLAAPFITIFSLIDKATNASVLINAYLFPTSWSYFGFVFASSFYFLAGLYLYIRAFAKFALVSSWEHLLLASGLGVIYYVTYRPVMGHAYEFFSLALVTCGTCKLINSHKDNTLYINFVFSFFIAAGILLTLLIRPANLQVFLLPFIITLTFHTLKEGESPHFFKASKNAFLFGSLWLGLLVIPFISYNWFMFGEIYPTFKTMYGESSSIYLKNIEDSGSVSLSATTLLLIMRLPFIFKVLFSAEFGVLYTSPILLFGLAFLYHGLAKKIASMKKTVLMNLILISVYVGLPLSLVIIWQSYADAYGYRFLFSLYPLAILGYVLWKSNTKNLLNKALHIIIVGLSFFAIMSVMFYGLNDKLKYHVDENALEDQSNTRVTGYTIAVLQASIHPSSWLTLAAYRMPGFMLINFLEKIPQGLQSNSIIQKGKAKVQNRIPPTRVYMQASIIFFMFFIFLLIVGIFEYKRNALNQTNLKYNE
ncbi:MAG TPA: hypothetical protein VFP93_01220 [Gammaproteobacteria bacterium]|nr:hypothetical protein [Gammaproteobacteria bacterium]